MKLTNWAIPRRGVALLWLCSALSALAAISPQDPTTMWNSYSSAFYLANGGNAYFRQAQGGTTRDANWICSEEIETACDIGDTAKVTALITGFDSNFGTDLTARTIYNDDVMWACLAHLRAYFLTDTSSYAQTARNNFDWIYNGGHGNRTVAQYDNTYGGGLWWTTNHTPSVGMKPAAANGPAAIVAHYLDLVYPGQGYGQKMTNIYNWEKSRLLETNGLLNDLYNNGGAQRGPAGDDYSYNIGTFVGAAYYMNDSASANLAAAYFMYHACTNNYIFLTTASKLPAAATDSMGFSCVGLASS